MSHRPSPVTFDHLNLIISYRLCQTWRSSPTAWEKYTAHSKKPPPGFNKANKWNSTLKSYNCFESFFPFYNIHLVESNNPTVLKNAVFWNLVTCKALYPVSARPKLCTDLLYAHKDQFSGLLGIWDTPSFIHLLYTIATSKKNWDQFKDPYFCPVTRPYPMYTNISCTENHLPVLCIIYFPVTVTTHVY